MYCSSSITPISDSKRASSGGETQEENPERAETRTRIWRGRRPDPESGAGGDENQNLKRAGTGRGMHLRCGAGGNEHQSVRWAGENET